MNNLIAPFPLDDDLPISGKKRKQGYIRDTPTLQRAPEGISSRPDPTRLSLRRGRKGTSGVKGFMHSLVSKSESSDDEEPPPKKARVRRSTRSSSEGIPPPVRPTTLASVEEHAQLSATDAGKIKARARAQLFAEYKAEAKRVADSEREMLKVEIQAMKEEAKQKRAEYLEMRMEAARKKVDKAMRETMKKADEREVASVPLPASVEEREEDAHVTSTPDSPTLPTLQEPNASQEAEEEGHKSEEEEKETVGEYSPMKKFVLSSGEVLPASKPTAGSKYAEPKVRERRPGTKFGPKLSQSEPARDAPIPMEFSLDTPVRWGDEVEDVDMEG